MSKLAALYARVSTREQKDHGTSLDSQIEAMRSWAGDNGYEVGYEFAEDWTGTELDRPKLNEVKRLAEVEEIDAVLVYSWDRLARDMGHQHVLRYLFEEKWGVKLICVTQPEMDELASKIYQSAIAMAAEIENRLRRERVTRGVRQAAITRGQLPGGGAGLYGYDYSPKSRGGNGKRTISEEEARVVRLIYSLVTEKRMSLYEIAKRLEQMGICTKKGLKKWRRCTIYRMVTNPAYCGKTYAFRWEGVEPEKPVESNRREEALIHQTPSTRGLGGTETERHPCYRLGGNLGSCPEAIESQEEGNKAEAQVRLSAQGDGEMLLWQEHGCQYRVREVALLQMLRNERG